MTDVDADADAETSSSNTRRYTLRSVPSPLDSNFSSSLVLQIFSLRYLRPLLNIVPLVPKIAHWSLLKEPACLESPS